MKMFRVKWSMVLACGVLLSAGAAEMAALRVEGRRLLAGEREIRLRGINWGWWNLEGTRYTENDMRRQAAWGANHLRLAFYYRDYALPDGSPNPEKLREIDEVIQWAEKYRQYVILDLHTYSRQKRASERADLDQSGSAGAVSPLLARHGGTVSFQSGRRRLRADE